MNELVDRNEDRPSSFQERVEKTHGERVAWKPDFPSPLPELKELTEEETLFLTEEIISNHASQLDDALNNDDVQSKRYVEELEDRMPHLIDVGYPNGVDRKISMQLFNSMGNQADKDILRTILCNGV